MTRRSPGEGNLRKKPRGGWEGRYTSAGKRRYVYGKTRAEALAKLKRLINDVDAGYDPMDQRMTTGEYLIDWLEHQQRPRVRLSTYRTTSVSVKTHLIPTIGHIPLVKLQPEHIERMLADLVAGHHDRRPLQPSTARTVLMHLRLALARAVKFGRLQRNVAALIDAPRIPHSEMLHLDAEQARRLLAELRGHELYAVFLVALGTGMRHGEILGLRWRDVDWDRGELRVRHSWDRSAPERFVEPKTERSKRNISLPSSVLDGLREHRTRQLKARLAAGADWVDLDLVFTDDEGGSPGPQRTLDVLRAALDRARLPKIRFHDLRHTFATLQLEAGEDLANISKILGHASLATTADLYVHLTPKVQRAAAERMDRILTG